MIQGVFTGTKYTEMLPAETMSAQGTAVRRIRLKSPKGRRNKHEKPPPHGDHKQTSEKKVTGCVFSVLGGSANTLAWFHPAYLVILLFFILFFAWRGNYMEVSVRQLKCWLRKASDYI